LKTTLPGTPEKLAFESFTKIAEENPQQALAVARDATATTMRGDTNKPTGLPAWQLYAPPYLPPMEHRVAEQATAPPHSPPMEHRAAELAITPPCPSPSKNRSMARLEEIIRKRGLAVRVSRPTPLYPLLDGLFSTSLWKNTLVEDLEREMNSIHPFFRTLVHPISIYHA